jgi:fido (protein-threonine AMPylation protein)
VPYLQSAYGLLPFRHPTRWFIPWHSQGVAYSLLNPVQHLGSTSVWDWAGDLRSTEILPIGSAPEQIAIKLLELEHDVEYWRESACMPPIEQAARLHHRAVAIHPFPNGNGRWSRMLANIYLRQGEGWFIDWPESNIARTSTVRTEYLESLRRADRGNYASLIALHEEFKSESMT